MVKGKNKNSSPNSTQPTPPKKKNIVKKDKGNNSQITQISGQFSQTSQEEPIQEPIQQSKKNDELEALKLKPQEKEKVLDQRYEKQEQPKINPNNMTTEQQLAYLFQRMDEQNKKQEQKNTKFEEQDRKIEGLQNENKELRQIIGKQNTEIGKQNTEIGKLRADIEKVTNDLNTHLKMEQISILGQFFVKLRDKIFGSKFKNYHNFQNEIQLYPAHIQAKLNQQYQQLIIDSGFTEEEIIALSKNYSVRNDYCHDMDISKLEIPLFSSSDAYEMKLNTICQKITNDKNKIIFPFIYSNEYVWKVF